MIDSHVHIVSGDEKAYPRLAAAGTNSGHPSRTICAEDLIGLADGEGIDRVVLVQSFAAYAFDNRYVVDMARKHPDRFVCVCGVDPLAPDAGERSSEWVRAGARGLRALTLQEDFDLDTLRPLFDVALAEGVAVCLLATPPILSRLSGFLRDYPGVPLVLDHCGLQALNGERGDLGAPALLELASVDSVHLKISSRVFGSAEGDASAVVERLVDRFGAERIMWGSDFPASPVASYTVAVDQARDVLAKLGASARDKILHETSERVWRLGEAG